MSAPGGGPLVGDVEKVANLIMEPKFAFFLGDVFADHHHAKLGRASGGPIGKLSNLFGLQTQCFKFMLAHEGLFDVRHSLPSLGFGLRSLAALQGKPGVFRQILGDAFEVVLGIVAEDEADATIVVPAVEMFRLRKIGVAPHEDFAKACTQARGASAIQRLGGAFVRGAIARPIDEAQDFAGVGERDEERVISPGAVVGDADACFVFRPRGHQGAVGVEDGASEEGVGLSPPDADANVIVDVLERVDVVAVEASAEIARRGGVGDALGAERVEEVDIVAA